ncbi:MAG: hypothetical protein DHS20C15_21910 [Planctomycetota bacterium]|nr:MAG: hypothetical protein DHS20C15_21910 [Planctomycetota bacterium]
MIASLLLAAAFLPPADSETELQKDDISFAENLARYQYFDLAGKVIGELEAEVGRDASSDLLGDLAFVEARIHKAESERALDPARRAEARSAAIERFSDFSKTGSSFAFHDRLLDALEDLADLHMKRADELSRKAAAGDAEAALDAADDYQAADEALERLQDEAMALAEQQESNGEDDKATRTTLRANLTLYLRGLNGINWARVSESPAFRLEEAIENLDDFLWEVDEFALLYPMATFEQGRAYATLAKYTSDPDESAEYLSDALDILSNGVLNEQNTEVYWESINDFAPAGQAGIAALFDRTWAYMAELEVEGGDLDAAQAWIDRMRSEHERLGVRFGPDGLRALTDWGIRLSELGQTDAATDILKFVAGPEGGRGTPEGEEANSQLASLVQTQGVSAIASVDVLVSVGAGLRSEQNYAEAGYAYLRAYGLISTDEERELYTQEALGGAASALRAQGRFLEAAMAYELQLEDLRARNGSDLIAVEKVAVNLIGAFEKQYKASGDDFDRQLRSDTQDRLNKIPGISLDVQFIRASELLSEAEQSKDPASFMQALVELEGVPETSPNYEYALVKQGEALEGAGRYDDALARFNQMIERAADPALAPTNAQGLSRREGALAQARYSAATLLLSDELQRADDALAMLQDFEEDVPGQETFHAPVKYQRVLAYAMAGRFDEAEDALDVLRNSKASSARIQGAALATYSTLKDAAEAVEVQTSSEAREFWSRAARALSVANEVSEYASFTNGLLATQHYLAAGEPAEAEATARAVEKAHQDRKPPTSSADALKIALATSLDEQGDYGRARPIWKDLEARNPNRMDVLVGAARSYGGWLAVDENGDVIEIPGSGDYGEANELWVQKIYGVVNQTSKHEPIWWETKLGGIYTDYRRMEQDSSHGTRARSVLTNVQLFTPQYDKTVQELLPEDKRFTPRYFTLFRYLDRKLPK